MKKLNRLQFYFLTLLLSFNTLVMGQHLSQEKMKQLDFMVGNWVGTSTTFKNGIAEKQVPAFQQIKYAVNKNIITIDLHSETLQLHTVIYYDEQEKKYFYNPFYEKGAGKFVAEYIDGKLIVTRDKTTRFIFGRTADDEFQEYGEKLVNGKWIKYFEDNFKDIQ